MKTQRKSKTLLLNDNQTRWEFDQNYRQTFPIISGSDEAGRGAMAGPIVVASVIMDPDFFDQRIKDSKKLSESMREQLYDVVIEHALDYQIAIFDANQVDQLNPKQASILGMKQTIIQLKLKVNCALVDGEKLLNFDDYHPVQIIKGDDLSFSIACASILAKVSRDHIMREYGKLYPEYGFEKHKGYVTKFHYQQVKKYGVLEIHRKSYQPIKNLLKEKQ